ncbi:MAG: cytochrome c biogenesis protein CcsA [Chloroflexaceae bacterium]|nr:cytochrome c biogenesis protein CcsA [Chloroflexaceae bacterium]
MYLFGTTMLVAGLVMALLAVGSYTLVIRGNWAALPYGRAGVYGMLITMVIVWLTLMTLFLSRRFDFEYVNNYSSSDLDTFFTVAAIWAGQPGSFAVWVLWSAIAAVLLLRQTRHFEPYVQVVSNIIIAALIVFTLVLNPFTPLTDPETGLVLTPPDGQGLNPLLHNFWMIIHPPILFWGFALAIFPFAFAIAALIRRDYDTWAVRATPWILSAWAFLGVALLLGGYWAYETLGWGGYWAWDPVENSSLVPWLILTALLHGVLVQRQSGALRRTNLVLAVLSFITVFYSTFLTRSGVLANFSVHSFVEEGIYGFMLTFLLSLIVVSFGIVAWRWRDIPSRSLSDNFFSRDNFFALAMLTVFVVAVVVALGTSMPVISAIPGVGHSMQNIIGSVFEIDDGSAMFGEPLEDGRFNMAQSFYWVTTPPLVVVALILMTVGPLLGWRSANMGNVWRALRWPGLAAVVATIIALVVGVREIIPLLLVTLGIFALGTNILMIERTIRGGWLRIGGYLAHVGFCVLVIGVVGSSAYSSPEERLSFAEGDTITYRDYEITFNKWQETPEGGGVLDLTVRRGDEVFSAQPELYFNEQMGTTIQNPAIKSYIWQDFYIAPADYVPAIDPARPVLGVEDTVEMGPYLITFNGFDIDSEAMMRGESADVGASLTVQYDEQTLDVSPRMRLMTDPNTGEASFENMPVTLPGGQVLSLVTFHPGQRLVMLQGEGEGIDNLPVQPAKAVITASVKPLVILVWLGMIIGAIGGVIAFIRRTLESRAKLAGESAKLPKGFPLPRGMGWGRRTTAR